ncbi:prolipoprotein diacylglyceryl transferase [Methylocaldum szegediense]|jgi:prolipoprotein diacylglyceryl transferase|uniref:Phosphatidylglycerol--prolipoprotein diacylglyceryl transferase n=1 Tax=Methylocaldum szegediense TaxID=73780 RepID=A0ABM9HYU1_9GAMM|nr:prolipoprotein diacylglyceryl transferase [Methylocaldum szegediense]CAI8774313.1 Phosphatidylglycerol--prolipoprotein diacylglyceryl transferase [Methylocaldum szegediense]
MLWDVAPVAFTISIGSFHLPVYWYGLFFASTFVYGLFIFRYLFRREGRPEDEVYDLVLFVLAGTVIGARLGHVLFYNPGFYLSHPWKILAVWEGGLASHGAVVGILIAVWLYSRRATDQPFLWVCDRIGVTVPLSGCLIRIGNFFNSEILGRPTDVPWAVIFARVDALPRHPAQLYEALCYLLIFLIQFRFYLKHGNSAPLGHMFGRFFILVFGARFVLEFFKEGQAAFESGWTITMGQWLSIPVILVGVYLIWRARRLQQVFGVGWDAEPRRPDAPET